ncbi:MAG: SoxR reducing system RseC family protein [Chitinophagaceae bacterium]
MARSHHRKKHREHLRQYQHHQEGTSTNPKKTKVSGTFAILGVILGVAVGYFATDGNTMWIAFGAIAGGLLGYLSGRYFDRETSGK